MGSRRPARRSEGAAVAPRRLAGRAADLAAHAVHRMALWRLDQFGVTRPNSVDSPLMVALGNTELGKWMNDSHIQVYGWVNGGGNLSTNTVTPGGNSPASYDYTPNAFQLDQAVVYFERLPDTVQTDHIDWGFRFSAIYGENYRYTTAFGVASYQLLGHNLTNGLRLPDGVRRALSSRRSPKASCSASGATSRCRTSRRSSRPNNYMYTHSMTYTFDNYTNTGMQTTTGAQQELVLAVGRHASAPRRRRGTGARRSPTRFPNPVYPGYTMLRDPGAKPSVTTGVRWQSDSGGTTSTWCANAINDGTWGYNNLSGTASPGTTTSIRSGTSPGRSTTLSQKKVLNAADPAGNHRQRRLSVLAAKRILQRAGHSRICSSPYVVTCTARGRSPR